VSFISVYHFLALSRPASRSKYSWYILLYFVVTAERCRVIPSYLLCSALTLLSCKRALNVDVSSFMSEDCLWFAD
jgi:hypothetical protein